MMRLDALPERFAICLLDRSQPVALPPNAPFVSVTRNADELSWIGPETDVPNSVLRVVGGWRLLKVAGGPLDFDLVGILAELCTVLANAGISLNAVSTYHTDYLMVKETILEAAAKALRAAGHEVNGVVIP